MTDPTTPKPRGRPATGRARSPAQRMADLRARARECLTAPDVRPADLPDSGLLEMIRSAYARRAPALLAEAATELLRRLGHDIPVTVTEKTVTVTEPPPAVGTVRTIKQMTYPADVRSLAVQMHREGTPSRAILGAIERATGGTAPDIGNLGKALARWAKSAD